MEAKMIVSQDLYIYIYEPVTKGPDLKWDTLPQNQTPNKLFSVSDTDSSSYHA